ncbi:MAG: beta-ketoacyl-ACP synthase III [Acidimicrobiales bacterium]
MSATRGMAVAGLGSALPPTVLTNADLERTLDTSDAWISERTGIRERRVGGSTGDLAVQAARAALDDAGVDPSSIDLLILATETPDALMPATSAAVAGELGLRCGSFDLNAACAGFTYGLVIADQLVKGGLDRVLLVGSDTMWSITDHDDRNTAVLFGDGAGALVLEATADESAGMLGWDAGTDGTLGGILSCEIGGSIQMDGQAVFKKAVRVVVESCAAALERAKLEGQEIDVFAPHQANLRIIDAAAGRLGISADRCAVVLDRTGNTSAGSIPLALAEARDGGRLHDGAVVLVSGFGAGMTWASAVLRWATPRVP